MTTDTVLPIYPPERSRRCPYEPPPLYTTWRETEGLHRASLKNGTPMWVVSRFDDIRAVMSDPRFSADSLNPNLPDVANGFRAFIRMDDPDHARLRRTLIAQFTGRRMASIRPRVEESAIRYIDEMMSKGGPADLVRDFAMPFPFSVICVLLGVPASDQEFFTSNTATVFDVSASAEERGRASGTLVDYLNTLAELREAEPTDDLISLQVEHIRKGDLTHEEALSNCLLLMVTGHESVTATITLGTLALLQHPDQAARIRNSDDPAVIANAVEEVLRYVTVLDNGIFRVATEDVTVGGHLVRAGQPVILCLAAGNRDTVLTDQPDVLDVDRHLSRGHLGFGHGVHQCLGKALARMELQIALPTLLRRLPGLRLAVPPDELDYRGADNLVGIVGLNELPVVW